METNKKELASQLFFAKEAAEYLNITVQRLNVLTQQKRIIPLKKSSSGTVYLKEELDRRKRNLEDFHVLDVEHNGRFMIDDPIKKEAFNFSVLMLVLKWTENKLEPKFDEFSENYDVTLDLKDSCVRQAYASFFGCEEDLILSYYKYSFKAFSSLQKGDVIVKRGCPGYPELLMRTKEAPRFLYLRGNTSLLNEKRTVALVGSRGASEKSKNNTARLAKVLGRNGIVVVSGLALGIDVTAHRAALENGCHTIAVIGTNLNKYYPPENESVQKQIEKNGLVVSQFSPVLKTERWFFPLRNGVMSGLSLATVVMEAGETSGALKQADYALKQNRQVMIPKSAMEMESISWPGKFVKRGAVVVESPTDVIKHLAENSIFQVATDDDYSLFKEAEPAYSAYISSFGIDK